MFCTLSELSLPEFSLFCAILLLLLLHVLMKVTNVPTTIMVKREITDMEEEEDALPVDLLPVPMLSLDCLPNEILERIAMDLDGETLVHWKRTCSRFRAIVAQMPINCFWRRRCLVEIPPDVLIDMGLPNVSPEDMYVSWYLQRRLEKAGLHKNGAPSPTVSIYDTWRIQCSMTSGIEPSATTSMAVSGDVVVTGHGSGQLLFWDVGGEHCKPIGDVALHRRKITTIILIDHYNHEFVSKKRQPAADHHHVLTVSADNTVKTMLLQFDHDCNHRLFTYMPTVHVQLGQASAFKDVVAVSLSNGSVELLQMALVDERLELKHLQTIKFRHRDARCWIGLWRCQLTVIQSNMDCYTVRSNQSTSHLQWMCHPPKIIGDCSASADNPLIVRQCELFRGTIVFLRTMNGQMGLSIDGRNNRIYSTLKTLRGVCTCAAVKCNLIALGTNYGSVFLYHFESEEQLQSLDLDRPVWKGRMKFAIGTLSMRLHPQGPILVATDCKSVLVVKWNFRSTS